MRKMAGSPGVTTGFEGSTAAEVAAARAAMGEACQITVLQVTESLCARTRTTSRKSLRSSLTPLETSIFSERNSDTPTHRKVEFEIPVETFCLASATKPIRQHVPETYGETGHRLQELSMESELKLNLRSLFASTAGEHRPGAWLKSHIHVPGISCLKHNCPVSSPGQLQHVTTPFPSNWGELTQNRTNPESRALIHQSFCNVEDHGL